MHLTSALNIVLGSSVLVILVCIDYVRKYNTDDYLRRLFLGSLGFTFIAMAADFVYYAVFGLPGKTLEIILYCSLFAYYFFQVLSYFFIALFVDYFSFKNRQRTKKMKIAVWIITAVHGLILVLNYSGRFYFYLDENNFAYGNMYFIRVIFTFLPVVFAGLTVSLRFTHYKSVAPLLLVFVLLTSIGSTIDLVFKTNSLVWPCLVAAQLYAYFFIIQNDLKLDSLTGLGNRYSFNEFMDKLDTERKTGSGWRFDSGKTGGGRHSDSPAPSSGKKQKAESYSIVMIDMDHFKAINDTLGHLEGDNALRDMAAIIKSCVRHSDLAARYGGDEFVLATKGEYDVTILLGRIQAAIDEQNRKKQKPYKLQISYGYDIYTTNKGVLITDFIKHIDSLMYKHKSEQRRAEDSAKGGTQ